jgi:hypothetical protein
MRAAARSASAATPPTTPPAIGPVCLCDCDTDESLALDEDAAAVAAVDVMEVGPVGGGRRVRLEDEWDVEEARWLLVVDEDELEEVEGLGEELSDCSIPFTAYA